MIRPSLIWFDDDGTPYDDPAIKSSSWRTPKSLSNWKPGDFSNNVTLQAYEIDRLEWWQGLHAGVLGILEKGWQPPLSGLWKTASCPTEILAWRPAGNSQCPSRHRKGSRTGKQTHSETHRPHCTGQPETTCRVNRKIHRQIMNTKTILSSTHRQAIHMSIMWTISFAGCTDNTRMRRKPRC